jgi:glycosyltransferase involved in cell wall biosynthesis
MARQFKEFSGRDFVTVPHVTSIPPETVWRHTGKEGSPARVHFGTFGFTRYDKGLDVLQEAIRRLPEPSRGSPEFVLQWTGDYSLPSGRRITPDLELVANGQVTFIPAFSDSDEYYKWLGSIDAIVLPYRKDFYRDRMSRVAVDAALAGLPVVYPKDTWLEDFHTTYGAGVPFLAEDPDSLAAAIASLAGNYHEHSMIAHKNITRTRRDFSGEAFFSIIEQAIKPR